MFPTATEISRRRQRTDEFTDMMSQMIKRIHKETLASIKHSWQNHVTDVMGGGRYSTRALATVAAAETADVISSCARATLKTRTQLCIQYYCKKQSGRIHAIASCFRRSFSRPEQWLLRNNWSTLPQTNLIHSIPLTPLKTGSENNAQRYRIEHRRWLRDAIPKKTHNNSVACCYFYTRYTAASEEQL